MLYIKAMDEKTALRIRAKNLRKIFDIKGVSALLSEAVRKSEIYKTAKNVMLYYPTKYEVNLLSLLSDDKNFYFPRTRGEGLEVCRWEGVEKMKLSEYNIMEPTCEAICPKEIDLVIVPALMADKSGYRLGYGGGYYDRFLANFSGKTLCAIPKEFYTERLPHEEFDIPVDLVITD